MTPIQKAETALNARIEEAQAKLRAASPDQPRPDLVQGVLIWAGLGETITQYVAAIGDYAKKRHAELKETQVTLIAQHEEHLREGNALLERLKADPTSQELRKEINQTQKAMESIQKTLRKAATTLEKEVNPCIRIIDTVAENVYRLCESKDKAQMKRATKAIVQQPQELYRAHPALPSKGIIDTASWELSAEVAIDEAPNFFEAQARGGFQAMLAVEIMILGISPAPPQTAEAATERANAAVSARLKKLMERLSESGNAS